MTLPSDDPRVESPPPADIRAPKLPYVAPLLHVYGDLRAITTNVGMTSAISDGGGAPGMSKTH
jgi:hypothetical protein